MKTIYILVIAIFLIAQSSFANKVCLQDSNGVFWELTGGRADKKTHTVKRILPGCCESAGYADVTVDGNGVYKIAIYASHHSSGNWSPVLISLNGDELYNSTGTFDLLADGSVDGTISFTNVPCSMLPVTIPEKQKK